MDEHSRPFANGDEQTFTLTIDEAVRRYEAAGHARTPRAIQKYCARGDLDCVKEETAFGQRYRITPESVARHLSQIEEVHQANVRDQSRTDAAVRSLELPLELPKDADPNVRERTRPDANVRAPEHSSEVPEKGDEQTSERSRPVATDTRYVDQLERENAYLREQNNKKDQQLERRDQQIDAMIERDRETNILIKGLQELMPQLGEGAQRTRPHGGRDDGATLGDNPTPQM